MIVQPQIEQPLSPHPVVHRQGTLDGLCGIYCIINAISLMADEADANAFDPHDLFAALLISLKQQLGRVTVRGMHATRLNTVLRAARNHLAEEGLTLSYRKLYHTPRSLGELWGDLRDHQANHGPGSILIGLSGRYEHWTCVRAVEHDRLRLADSGTLTTLWRDQLTIGRRTKQRHLVVEPCQVFLLGVEHIA